MCIMSQSSSFKLGPLKLLAFGNRYFFVTCKFTAACRTPLFYLPHAERKSRFLVKQRNLMEDFCSLAQ